MNIESFRDYCLSLPLVTEDMPFDDTVIVYRLKGKIFGCITTDKPDLIVLKCDPTYALELRAQYDAVEGAWHWNKKYWNQIVLNGSLTDGELSGLIRHAYNEVNKKLPKAERVEPLS